MDIKDVQKLISEKKDNVLIPMVQSMSENFAKCFETGVEVGIEIGKAISPDYPKVWHKPSEEPNEYKEVFFEWDTADAIWHDVGFYHKDTKDFSKDNKHQRYMSEVAKWAYVEDLVAF